MSDQTFDFWRDHSLKYLEMAYDTQRMERPEHSDGHGSRTGECGDTIEMFLEVSKGKISRVSFDARGCLNTRACANMAASLVEGRPTPDAWSITSEQVAGELETLPADHIHCAELAVGALYLALSDYEKKTAPSPSGGQEEPNLNKKGIE